MSRSKDPNKYPRHYFALLDWFLLPENEDKEMRILCKTEAEATNFRLGFNTFKDALASSDPLEVGGEARVNMANDLMVRIRKDPFRVLIQRRDFGPDAALIAQALVAQDPAYAEKVGISLIEEADKVDIHSMNAVRDVVEAPRPAYPSRAKKAIEGQPENAGEGNE